MDLAEAHHLVDVLYESPVLLFCGLPGAARLVEASRGVAAPARQRRQEVADASPAAFILARGDYAQLLRGDAQRWEEDPVHFDGFLRRSVDWNGT
ncbi:unnamed protein product [Effrenium voratum]|uniref:Uncharacterized protein n=1 Tax=Effrenium voratum TaxID=2562239 RepID=A0AA36HSV2_9DINO|nr:unnamed protein product [Effrenium voratum]